MSENYLGYDAIYKEPISEELGTWIWTAENRETHGSPFSMFWLAGPDEKRKPIIDAFARQFGVNHEEIIQIEIEPQQENLNKNLDQLEQEIRRRKNTRILIVADGFERRAKHSMIDDSSDFNISRAGHDWDQEVVEDLEEKE